MMATPALTVQQALAQFYQEHDFGEDGGVNEKLAYLKIGPVSVPIPNTQERREMIHLHDLNHIINGYDTSWRGESMVSTWEFVTGGWGFRPFIWGLIFSAMCVGLALFPKATFKAFVRGTYTRGLLDLRLPKSVLMSLIISDLQQRLGLQPNGVYPVLARHRWQFAGLYVVALGSWLVLILGAVWFGYRLFS
ncbi:MAG: hypothetical protein EAZ91_01635 [Cytophagales bacterium]|nr:MAG: hypothetical protein EAZ91_01635 [Cytophagales bacterium]